MHFFYLNDNMFFFLRETFISKKHLVKACLCKKLKKNYESIIFIHLYENEYKKNKF